MGKFVISKTKNGEFTFNLKAGNGQTILTASESYGDLPACKGGIASVQKNAEAHVEDQTAEGFEKLTHPKFEVYQDKAGEYRFRMKAKKRSEHRQERGLQGQGKLSEWHRIRKKECPRCKNRGA